MCMYPTGKCLCTNLGGACHRNRNQIQKKKHKHTKLIQTNSRTIHGFILYYNILVANSSLYFSLQFFHPYAIKALKTHKNKLELFYKIKYFMLAAIITSWKSSSPFTSMHELNNFFIFSLTSISASTETHVHN